MKRLILLWILPALFIPDAHAQSALPREQQIGPRGTDTSVFSKVYVIRNMDEMPNYYFGLMIDGYYGQVARINSNNCYEIRTPLKGKQNFYSTTDGTTRVSFSLELKERSVHYVRLTVKGVPQYPVLTYDVLNEQDGKKEVEKYKGDIHVRYSTIPYRFSGFLSDRFYEADNSEERMQDSVKWYADKKHLFSFVRPHSLDFYMDVMGLVSYGFYSRPISETYSEALDVMPLGKSKLNTDAEFDTWLNTKFRDKLNYSEERYKDFRMEVISKNDHAIGGFNALVFVEVKDYESANKGSEPYLLIREVIRVFSWKDAKGKTFLTRIRLSERGKEEELSTKEELIRKFQPTDGSIRVVRK